MGDFLFTFLIEDTRVDEGKTLTVTLAGWTACFSSAVKESCHRFSGSSFAFKGAESVFKGARAFFHPC